MQSRQVSNFKINKMTKSQYSGIVPSQDEVYITTDEADAVLSVNGILPNAQGNVTLSIPSAVTESTVAGWGFTKNVGTVTSVNGVSPTNGNVAITIPDISNLADKDLSNLSSTGKKVIDGQWVASTLTLASGVTYPTTTDTEYSLSTYLPDDSYDYDVIFSASTTTGTTSGNAMSVRFHTDILNIGYMIMANAITRTSFANYNSGTATVPIGSARKFIINAVSSYVGTYSITLKGYRRIGTNS